MTEAAMDEELKKVLVEARARIIWGNPISETTGWLKEKGLSETQIETVIQTCMHERAAEIRKRGFSDVVIGASLVIAGLLILVLLSGDRREFGRSLVYIMVGVIYGAWRVFRGIGRLIDGAKIRGSLTEM